jgi:hypothetical protein
MLGPYDPMRYRLDDPLLLLDRCARLARLVGLLSQRQHEDAGHRGSWLHCRQGRCLEARDELEGRKVRMDT